MDKSGELCQGDILWVVPGDDRGRGKVRPVVVISPDPVELLDEPFAAVALTTTFEEPPPAACIPIPWYPQGHPVTGLRKRTAAFCDWLVAIRPGNVRRKVGRVPSLVLLEILRRVSESVGGGD